MKLDATVAAVVTGGASGLGLATARALTGQGVKVAIFDRNDAEGTAVAASIGALFVRVDVQSDESVTQGFVRSRAAIGQERILVNCAGIVAGARTATRDRKDGSTRKFPIDLFARIIDVNLVGTFRCVAESASGMLTLTPDDDGERGVVVNTASIAGVEGQIGQAAYAASKGGVLGLTLPVARDLAPEGIRVNAIMPGIVETPMMAGMTQEVRESLAATVPFPRRLGRPDEFASLAVEICRNRYMNGGAYRLDGALRMQPR